MHLICDSMKKHLSSGNLNMKNNKKRHIVPMIVLFLSFIFLVNPATALSGYAGNNSSISAISYSGDGITEASHLIELYFEEDNYILAGESVVFSQPENSSEKLVMWIPENASIMQFFSYDMMGSSAANTVNYSRDGDLLYITQSDNVNSTGMPLIYEIRYTLAGMDQTSTPVFTKFIRSDESFGYPVSRLILLVHHGENEVPSIISADGTTITADEVRSESNRTSYIWSSPQFEKFSVTLQKEQTAAGSLDRFILPLIMILIIAAAVVYYKKREKRDLTELQDIYDAQMAVIAKIKEDRKKNLLSGEEYENILKKHTENASRIKEKMERKKS